MTSASTVINCVVMTKNDPEAFRIICALARQLELLGRGKLLVVDDHSQEIYLRSLIMIAGVHTNVDVVQRHLAANFAEQRNYAMTLLPHGEWVLFVDADEWVDWDFIGEMTSLVSEQNDIDVWYIPRLNTDYDDRGGMRFEKEFIVKTIPRSRPDYRSLVEGDHGASYPDYQGRLIRNAPDVRFVGAVHETIVCGSRKTGMVPCERGLLFHHRRHKVTY